MKREHKARTALALTRLAAFAVDSAAMAAAYASAFVLRFDFREPLCGWGSAALSFITVWAVQSAALLAFGCTKVSWRRMRLVDAPRFLAATTASCAVLTAMRMMLPAIESMRVRPPYSVTVINWILATIAILGVRCLWHLYTDARAQDEKELINRSETSIDAEAVVDMLRGACVLVTGAGGTIGSELVRQTVRHGARKVVMVERCENALYEIDREMRQLGAPAELSAEMLDCADCGAMKALFARERPDIVLHAAAYKHVPMVESHPSEGLANNTLASRSLAEISLEAGVKRFVLISTDKAVNPLSVMGITKRLAEIAVTDLNGGATVFSAVRFGNVAGSSGSVIPLFREQIKKREPVTVTHPRMKRYFMTAREAAELVLEATTQDSGGAIYVLDMGKPVSILDLAEQMIRRAGYRPYVDIPVRFTGIRPGEKLFEELDVSEKNAYKTGHARIFVCRTRKPDPARVGEMLAAARRCTAERLSGDAARDAIRNMLETADA